MHRPCLDQTVYTMVVDVVPAAVIKANSLEGLQRVGAAITLTYFQSQFKKAWNKLAICAIGTTDYRTDVTMWTCRCGSQQLHAHHLCKHLVHAVGKPPPDFFGEITRRRTMPIYTNSLFGNLLDKESASTDAGDDFVWMGNRKELGQGRWKSIAIAAGVSKRSRGSPSRKTVWPLFYQVS